MMYKDIWQFILLGLTGIVIFSIIMAVAMINKPQEYWMAVLVEVVALGFIGVISVIAYKK